MPPTGITLKDPKQFQLIGTSTKRLDTPARSTARATFGIDVKRPGMLYAVLERCPVFGGKVASFDATKAKAVPGVKNVVQISNGVAVIADNTWSAMEGRKALTIQWDEGPRANTSTASLPQDVRRSGRQARRESRANGRRRGGSGQRARRRSKRCTKRRIFRTRPWSR